MCRLAPASPPRRKAGNCQGVIPYEIEESPRRACLLSVMRIQQKKANEIEPRFQPNCAIIGLNITPKEYRTPEMKKRMANEEANIYQPQKRRNLG
jgi:23S rRNA pseudoU1915 N3-methylase RlmH